MSAAVGISAADPSSPPVDLDASRRFCRDVAEREARNFYHGMKLVPEPQRSAMFALYTWMREADDLADAEAPIETKRERLDRFREQTFAIYEDAAAVPNAPMWPAVADLVTRYNLDRQWLDDMIAGQLLDQRQTRYPTFDDLYGYCYKVASVVGLCCVQIWGYDGDEETRKLAEWRGIAFQLTNILRDILEDAERDRVYLPAEDFDVFEISPTMFTLGKPADVLPGIQKTIDRAVEYYEKSAPLDRLVHAPGRPCLFAMTNIYRGILTKIQRDPAVVLSGQRVGLSKLRKGWIALRASMMRGRG